MKYSVTIREQDHFDLLNTIFSQPGKEGAAYLLCGRSITDTETRFLVKKVVPVVAEDYLVREKAMLSIASGSYVAIAKQAARNNDSVIFVHSHPTGIRSFSQQDDKEDPKLHEFLAERVPKIPHASMVISSMADISAFDGRVLLEGSWKLITHLRVIGKKLRIHRHDQPTSSSSMFFDRHIRAFGEEMQSVLRGMHIGIVGAGGTGSATAEQLSRLGVGTLSLFDGDCFEESNVNRVYGSRVKDAGRNKVERLAEHIADIGVSTDVRQHPQHINDESTAKALRECDVIFGCTDRNTPRGILTRLAVEYLIPVFDTGVKITSENGSIRDITGRVTVLMPGYACLFCRRRISPHIIGVEALSPEEQRALADEEYAPEIGIVNPAVITFTTTVASQAVNELIHHITGFWGEERSATESLLFFHENSYEQENLIRNNSTPPNAECGVCMKKENWGIGDRKQFLGLMWP